MAAHLPLRGTLGIWAHPDDEAYLAAGLLARTTDAGLPASCWYATLGELGTDDPTRWPPRRLAARRAIELRRALACLGAGRPIVAGFPDGGCAQVDEDRAVESILDAIRRCRPTRLVTFGPDGITGHPDHVAVSRWATIAWRRAGGPEAGMELLYATMRRSFLDRHRSLHDAVGLFEALPGGEGVACDDDEVALEVVLDAGELDRKRRVLAAHRSQTAPLAALVGEATYRRWWSVESFRRPTVTELVAAWRDDRVLARSA